MVFKANGRQERAASPLPKDRRPRVPVLRATRGPLRGAHAVGARMGAEPRGLVRLGPAEHRQSWGHRGRRGAAPLSHECPISQGPELFPLKPFGGERSPGHTGGTRENVGSLSSSCSGSRRDEREVPGLLRLRSCVRLCRCQEA